MTTSDPSPLPDDAQLARLNDALDARVTGRVRQVPGTVGADGEWLAAFEAVRDTLRRDHPELAPDDTERDLAITAALAIAADLAVDNRVPAQPAVAPATAPTWPAPDDTDPHDATADDGEHGRGALVVRPARWHRPVAVVSAAAAALLVVAVAALPRLGGSDADMSSDMATEAGQEAGATELRVTGGTSAPELSAGQVAGDQPGPTIDAIVGPATAPMVIDTLDALRALADSYATSISIASAESTMVGDISCELAATEVVLTEVVWRGITGFAVYDSVTGVVRVLDLGCTELVNATP